MSDSFVMYRSFHESLKELTREQYGNVMFAINEYALNGTETDLAIDAPVYAIHLADVREIEKR